MFSKRAGILVSKLGTETHGPGRGQENKLSSVPAAGGKIMGHAPFCKSAEIVTAPPLLKPPGPWVYITSTPAPVPVSRRHNKLS